jgi:fructokinase
MEIVLLRVNCSTNLYIFLMRMQKFRGRVESHKVQVVDTTGAGDAFCAGVLIQLGKDMSILENEGKLREALRFANACGAITTTERGAIPSLPDMDTVMRFISKVPA